MTKLDIIYKIAQMQETLNQISRAVVDLEEVELVIPEPNASMIALLKKGEHNG